MVVALAFSAKTYWCRADLTTQDKVVLDLVVEAMHRLGGLLRPQVGPEAKSPADLVLEQALPDVQRQCVLLQMLAARPALDPKQVCQQ